MVIYILIAVFGYLSWVNTPQEKILMSTMNILEVDYKERKLFTLGVVFIFLSVIAATPLCVIPGKDFVENIFIQRKMSKPENLKITFLFIFVCWIFASVVPNIEDILIILGATTNPFVGFILPILFYLQLFPEI